MDENGAIMVRHKIFQVKNNVSKKSYATVWNGTYDLWGNLEKAAALLFLQPMTGIALGANYL